MWFERLRTYLGLREAAKHYLLLGYAVIRRALVELDRRWRLDGGVFYLTLAELGDVLAGRLDAPPLVAARRKRRQAELAPGISVDTWYQWKLGIDLQPGRHEVQVRATDLNGRVQTEERRSVAPDGATGLDTIRVDVNP